MEPAASPEPRPGHVAPGALPAIEQIDVPLEEVRRVAARILDHSGYTPAEREVMLDILMYAELRGSTQGLLKLIPPGLPRAPTTAPITLDVDRGAIGLLNGNFNPAMVVMREAADQAVSRARTNGISLVGTFNTTLSTGAIGYYADRIARAGYIGIVASGTPAFVAPYGSATPMFGTNPLSIGVPSAGEPVVLDMTTAQIPWYAVLRARGLGQKIPDGAGLDGQGRATNDPHAVAALRTFDGGPRGSGLAMMLELLTGPLVKAQANAHGVGKTNWGNIVIAIDPAAFQPFGDFAALVSQYVAALQGLTPAMGHDRVMTPGQRGQEAAASATQRGTICVAEAVWTKLTAVVHGKDR